jgi:hypothetical protein
VKPWQRPTVPPKERDGKIIKATKSRAAAVADRIATAGADDLGPWLVRQGALGWDTTDKAVTLGIVLKTLGRDARDDVRDALCL